MNGLPSLCLKCNGPATAFSVADVPLLLSYITGGASQDQLVAQVREKVTAKGCAIATKSGVCVCSKKPEVRP